MDRRLMDDMQHLARTNLYWLSTEILGYDLVPSVHQPICDFFVQKNPARSFINQSEQKQRLVLDPRGHFKTTIAICDNIQWMLNFPDIRILNMSGTRELVTRIVQETKSHFQFNEKFRSLFPEFCPTGKVDDFGHHDSFTVPCRNNWKLREPTLSISTVESVKAGSHYDVGKFDDLVHEKNVGNKEQIAKTKQAFHYTTPLIDPGGYREVTGTCYDHSDLYSDMRESPDWLHHIRACWKERPAEKGQQPTYDLLFPERFTLRTLKAIQKENPALFSCQYLNQPMMGGTQRFSEALLNSLFIPRHEFPKESRLYITWDFAFSQKTQADYSVGAVGMFDPQGVLYILDIVRGRFLPDQLGNAVVLTACKYHPTALGIENAGGSILLEPAIKYGFKRMNQHVRIDWLKVPRANKVERIMALHPRMTSGRLKILDTIPYKKELVQEFTRLGRFGHDDIPDAISLLEQYAGKQDIHWPDEVVEMISAPQYSAAYYGGDLPAGMVG